MPDFLRKPGVTAHPLIATLTDANGPVDLPAGTTAQIRVKASGATTALLVAVATIVNPGALVNDPQRGQIEYVLQANDLLPGIYDVDWLVTIPGLGVQPFPEDGYQTLLVLEGADAI